MDLAHAERLRRRQERERDKRDSETPERREERLRVRRERDRARRAIRVANATADATQAHLQQLSAAQRARRSAESAHQRQAQLLQISAAQTERHAAETVAETEARLDCDRERHVHRAQRRMQPQPSLLEQPVVRHKMGAFHRHLFKLDRRWRHRYSTLRNLWWRNVSLAVRHFLACSYNLCSLLSVCDAIALFLAQARPTDDYHLPSIIILI